MIFNQAQAAPHRQVEDSWIPPVENNSILCKAEGLALLPKVVILSPPKARGHVPRRFSPRQNSELRFLQTRREADRVALRSGIGMLCGRRVCRGAHRVLQQDGGSGRWSAEPRKRHVRGRHRLGASFSTQQRPVCRGSFPAHPRCGRGAVLSTAPRGHPLMKRHLGLPAPKPPGVRRSVMELLAQVAMTLTMQNYTLFWPN